MISRRGLFASAIGCLVGSIPALADPPPGVTVDPELHAWFERQKNQFGGSCCELSDGHIIEDEDVRTTNGYYEVKIEGEWHRIKPHAMRKNALEDPNPTGHPIVWYRKFEQNEHGLSIYCFAPGLIG